MCLVLGFAAAVAASAASAHAADITLRFANFPPSGTFPCVAMEHWVEEVQKRTAGKVHVDTFPAGTLVDARSMVRGIMRGQADIGCISIAYFPGMFPLMSAFELPLGFRSAEQASRIMMEAILAFRPEEFSKLKVISAFTCPPSQIFTRNPLHSLEDFKGVRVRASGILAEEVALLGGNPVSMPQSETPEAIQRGAVDGVFTSRDVLKDMNFAQFCRHGLLLDMSVYPFLFIMNQETWERLPVEVRQVMDDLAMPVAEWTGSYVDAHGAKAQAWSEETYQAAYVSISEEERAKALHMVSPLIEVWLRKAEEKKLPAAEMLQFIKSRM